MKSILKNALVGLLLVAGTTKPVTQTEVDTTLATAHDTSGNKIITHKKLLETLEANFNKAWLSITINEILAGQTPTEHCTVTSHFLVFPYAYVQTIGYNAQTKAKSVLLAVSESSATGTTTVCGIIVENDGTNCTIKTITAAETERLLKTSDDSTIGLEKRGITSFCSVPVSRRGALYTAGRYLGGAAAVLAAGYIGKQLLDWYTNNAVANALKAAGFTVGQAPITQIVTPGQAAGVLAQGAGNILGGIFTSAKEALTPKA